MKGHVLLPLVLLVLLQSVALVSADHYPDFRSASFRWTRSSTASTTVTFFIETAYKADEVHGNLDWPFTNQVDMGDGFTFGVTQNNFVLYEVARDSRPTGTANWVVLRGNFSYTYATAGSYDVSFTSCCKIEPTVSNTANYRVSTGVELTGNSLGSPVVEHIHFKVMKVGQADSIPIAASGVGPLSYSMATTAQSSISTPNLPGSTLSGNTISWTPNAVGIYTAQVRVSQSDGTHSSTDFLVFVEASGCTQCAAGFQRSGDTTCSSNANMNAHAVSSGTSVKLCFSGGNCPK